MKAKYIGLLMGFAVGFVWMWLGFWALLFVVVAAAGGYVIGGVVGGDIDVQRYIDRVRRR